MKTLIITALTVSFLFTVNIATAQGWYIDTAKQNLINTGGDTSATYNGFIFQPELKVQTVYRDWGALSYEERYEYERVDTFTKFHLDTITEKEFNRYKRKYNAGIDTSGLKVKYTDTSFSLVTEKSIRTFKADTTDYGFFEYYLGFLKSLNLFLVHSIDGNNELGWLQLIDKRTGKSYTFLSDYDYPIETVFVSPKKGFLMGVTNDGYSDEALLSFLKINNTKSSYCLEGYYRLRINKTRIKDLAWINETSFVIAIDEVTLPESGEYIPSLQSRFLKVSFNQ